MSSLFSNLINAKNRRGFTLVEMLVVLAIFVIITGIILANLPDFKSQINLDLVAQEIALQMRSAQVFAVGSKSTGVASDNRIDFYGIHFGGSPSNRVSGGTASATRFNSLILYGGSLDDQAGESRYVEGPCREGGSNCLEVYSVPSGYSIENVCVGSTFGAAGKCLDGNDEGIDVYYRRPETEAGFYLGGSADTSDIVKVKVVAKKSGKAKYVRILRGGQVSVASDL